MTEYFTNLMLFMMMSYYIIIYQCVAPFPTKRFIGSFGDSFILTRRVKLQQWLRGGKQDTDTRRFLRRGGRRGRAEADGGVGGPRHGRPGANRRSVSGHGGGESGGGEGGGVLERGGGGSLAESISSARAKTCA